MLFGADPCKSPGIGSILLGEALWRLALLFPWCIYPQIPVSCPFSEEAMVGFGDRIKGLCEDRREWASYYIDYKALKR